MTLAFETTPPNTDAFLVRGSSHLVVVPSSSPLASCSFLPNAVLEYPLGTDTFAVPHRVLACLFEPFFKPTVDVKGQGFLSYLVAPARFAKLVDDLSEEGFDFSAYADLGSLEAALERIGYGP